MRLPRRPRTTPVVVLGLLAAGCAFAGSRTTSVDTRDAGLALGWTPSQCSTGEDADADGLADGCETALAAAFAPLLRAGARECAWDAGSGRLGGGYLYVVGRPAGSERVRIAYLPAYHEDCGSRSLGCVLRPATCRPHAGDSEAVVVEVGFVPARGRWRTRGVFLSAHCHGRSDGRCRWFRGPELAAFAWVDGVGRGAPVVWVARGKHAGYPSRAACDSGWWTLDTCDGNRAAFRFPVVHPRQNAGSRTHPFGVAGGTDCIAAEAMPWADTAARGTAECVWREGGAFRGWTGRAAGSGPSPYGRYLRERAEL